MTSKVEVATKLKTCKVLILHKAHPLLKHNLAQKKQTKQNKTN